jgi:hypothetical protein
MLVRYDKGVWTALVIVGVMCMLMASMVSAAVYDVSGTAYYPWGGVPAAYASGYIRVYLDGGYAQNGLAANSSGYFSGGWTDTESLVGKTMELYMANYSMCGTPLFSKTITWTCAAMTEVKNITLQANYVGVYVGDGDFKVAIHVEPHTSRTCTKSFPVIAGCGDIRTTEASIDVDAFPVYFDLTEYQGAEYGMAWQGMYSCAFTGCSDLSIGGIEWPGDGVSHAWTTCQMGPVAVPGWGWIYDYGMVSVVPHPETCEISYGDCGGIIVAGPRCNFVAGIGGWFGDDPCEPTATKPASWGSIKAMFK